MYKNNGQWTHIALCVTIIEGTAYAISKFGDKLNVYIHPIRHVPENHGQPFFFNPKKVLQSRATDKIEIIKNETLNTPTGLNVFSITTTQPTSAITNAKTAYYRTSNTVFENNEISLLCKKYRLADNSQSSLEKGLRNAATNNNIYDLKKFIELVNNIDAIDNNPDIGRTALHCSAIKGHNECYKLLLDSGASPNISDHHSNKVPSQYLKPSLDNKMQ